MKSVNLLFLLVIASVSAVAQVAMLDDGITICHTSPTEKFALFVEDDNFNMSHPDPLPYVHQSEVGKMITFKTPDGKESGAYALMAKKKTNNWIFVFQEWWGLNDHIKREAEDYFSTLGNVNVLALDMYDGKIATQREDAGKYMGEFKSERGDEIIKGALVLAGKNAQVATVGWCFGGGLSLQATLVASKQAAACVMYYGMPEENIDKLKTLNCDVLNIWPTQDQWINKSVMDKFESNMNAAGKNLTIKSYEADHAFANPSNPKFNKEFTADARMHSLEFIKARFK